eukprot:TRINITY_DN662_c0_g1_i2.p2 TRINITY_DN662_c0_g1~~TRINITY_DN662_c0_g1_i2.p2  ORF type:complete len:260 (-),score=11.09 TRINITY_DN662_c0_g1_i2:118-843(-)
MMQPQRLLPRRVSREVSADAVEDAKQAAQAQRRAHGRVCSKLKKLQGAVTPRRACDTALRDVVVVEGVNEFMRAAGCANVVERGSGHCTFAVRFTCVAAGAYFSVCVHPVFVYRLIVLSGTWCLVLLEGAWRLLQRRSQLLRVGASAMPSAMPSVPVIPEACRGSLYTGRARMSWRQLAPASPRICLLLHNGPGPLRSVAQDSVHHAGGCVLSCPVLRAIRQLVCYRVLKSCYCQVLCVCL